MNSIRFLYTAYGAVWLVHGLYITMLVRRYRRLRRELSTLN